MSKAGVSSMNTQMAESLGLITVMINVKDAGSGSLSFHLQNFS